MKSRVVEPQGTVLKVLINPSMSSEQIEKGDIQTNKKVKIMAMVEEEIRIE